MTPIRLTQTVQKGGCAAKIAATELRKILDGIQFPPAHPELMVDGRHFDDAAIYRISPDLALVQTIDFFTPIVDSPRLFGRVAACNAVSDVYAMGGRPRTALGVLAFPLATMDSSIISEVLQGACDLLKEANTNLVGGHSIDDDTLKFGLSVTGFVHPDQVWTNQGAKVGDKLILTKPLGTGTITAALKRDAVSEDEIEEVTTSMGRLNNVMDFLSPELLAAIHAATDITGFGLSGHSWQLAKASGHCLRLEVSRLPVFAQAPEFLKLEFLTKAHRTNREYTLPYTTGRELDGWQKLIVHDPQTSGGLLLAVSANRAEEITKKLASTFPGTSIIGEVLDRPAGIEWA